MAALVLVRLKLVVSSAAAHQLAAVHALRGLVAVAALRSQGTRGLVAQAVVGAGVDVDHVLGGRVVEALVYELQLSLVGEREAELKQHFKCFCLYVVFFFITLSVKSVPCVQHAWLQRCRISL